MDFSLNKNAKEEQMMTQQTNTRTRLHDDFVCDSHSLILLRRDFLNSQLAVHTVNKMKYKSYQRLLLEATDVIILHVSCMLLDFFIILAINFFFVFPSQAKSNCDNP